MYAEARKLSLIEDVLKVRNEATLAALEVVLNKSKGNTVRKPSIYDFVGIFTPEEANGVQTAISDITETIYPDDWK
jgi:hypothetical protein